MRKLLIAAAVLLLVGLILFLTVTSAEPSTPPPPAPGAEAVAAGRDAYRQLREAQGNRQGVPVTLGADQLAGLSAVASHGFRPDRLSIAIEGRQVVVHASHRMRRLGRWLNVTVRAEGPSSGFPTTRIRVGMWSLPPALSRWALQLGRLYLRRKVEVPPLNDMIRNFKVEPTTVSALVSLPGKSGLVDQMANAVAEPVDRPSVLRVYCALTDRQRRKPSSDFAEQVRRAFSVDPVQARTEVDSNRAALVALAMFGVDQRVGDFAQLSPADLGKCRVRGRADLDLRAAGLAQALGAFGGDRRRRRNAAQRSRGRVEGAGRQPRASVALRDRRSERVFDGRPCSGPRGLQDGASSMAAGRCGAHGRGARATRRRSSCFRPSWWAKRTRSATRASSSAMAGSTTRASRQKVREIDARARRQRAALGSLRAVLAFRACIMPRKRPAGLPSRKQILDFIASSDQPAGKREIARAFGLSRPGQDRPQAPAQGHGRRGADRQRRPAAPSTRRAACRR